MKLAIFLLLSLFTVSAALALDGDYVISMQPQLDLGKVFAGAEGVGAVEYKAEGDIYYDYLYIGAQNIHPAVGVSVRGNATALDEQNSAMMNLLDIRVGAAIYARDGSVIGLTGTVGLRDDQLTETSGSLFEEDGVIKEVVDQLNFQVGGRFAFYTQFINGHVQVVFLPMIDQYELETTINFDLNRINRTLVIADSIILEGSHRSTFDGSLFEGIAKIILSKKLFDSVNMDAYLDYGMGVKWSNGEASPIAFIGIRIRP